MNHREHHSRRASFAHILETSNPNLLATPHAALPSPATGQRSVYALPHARLSHAEMERLVFKKTIEDREVKINFNEAIRETGFGCFQVHLVLVCGLIFLTCSASCTALSFTLPAAQCDLSLSSRDMGIINTSPLFGMIVGTFIWGTMSDTKGRRLTLIVCLSVDFTATVIASFSFHKWLLLSARFLNGVGIIGAESLVFAYLGEFLSEEKRDALLFSMELFYNLGVVYIPSISWIILPLPVDINLGGGFHYHSWNLFTLATGFPGLIAIILLTFTLPESPKYLLTKGEIKKMERILARMFKVNHRGIRHIDRKYPVKVTSTEDPNVISFFAIKVIAGRGYCRELYNQYKTLFKRPTKIHVIKFCILDFFVAFSFLSLLIWLPELLKRSNLYKEMVEHGPPQTVCYASGYVKTSAMVREGGDCPQKIPTEVYTEALIICAFCIPATISLYFALEYVPKKILIVLLTSFAGSVTLSIAFAKNVYVMVALMCCFEASSTVIETILFVCVVEVIPTNVSGTALAITVTCGRIAAVLANIITGMLVDAHCEIVLYVMAGSFFSGSLVACTLPNRVNDQFLY
ncbi:hypothetical protein O3M35_000738 [Rhynocoris fuscipes]|uniref:Major facilitator superfamily (MFS) profile domain-containing protein n=1 Tax=Rhynocoris fuscipes TaxID=488301 RepID=A0AAW1DR68_9HEMI